MRRLLVLLLLLLALPAPGARAALTTTEGQATYYPQDPVRVLDTRQGTGRVGPGGVLDVTLPGAPAGAVAAVLNVTAVDATASTNVRVYPTPASGSAYPNVSNLNVVAGGTVAGSVTTKLGPGSSVRLRNDAGSVHLLVDLAGFYASGGGGAGFTGATPSRALDTRQTGTPLQGGAERVVTLTGVPASATAAVLNVTAVGATVGTYLKVYPGPGQPTVSSLNPPRGQTVANLVVTKVTAQTVRLLLGAGTADVVIDLAGWYQPDNGDVFHPVDPVRVLDTRTASPVVAGSPYRLVLAGATSLPWVARSVALNVTAVGPTQSTYVAVYPYETETPSTTTSNLNVGRGGTVPNAVLATTGEGGAVRLAVGGGSVDLLADVAGWFGPPGDGWDISWPQCTSKGSTTSNHPTSGAFALVGRTRGTPFTDNECFADEYAWAGGLPGGAAVYFNVDAPGPASSHWTDAGPRATCDGTAGDADCGWTYGHNLVGYALDTLHLRDVSPKPQVFLDVENGSTWQTAGVNGNVVIAAVNRLRAEGYRVGIYSHRTDWSQIMGGLQLTKVQNWTFSHTGDGLDACSPAASFSGGPVVMRQFLVSSESPPFDHDHVC